MDRVKELCQVLPQELLLVIKEILVVLAPQVLQAQTQAEQQEFCK
jgi:hypothetical protein